MSVHTDYPENWRRVHEEGQTFILKGIARLRTNGIDYSDEDITALLQELLGTETKSRDIVDRAYLACHKAKEEANHAQD